MQRIPVSRRGAAVTGSRTLKTRVGQALVGSPRLLSAVMVLEDFWWGARLALGRTDTSSGTIHSTLSLEESVQYVEGVFADYARYGAVDRFRGRAAELGPGDNVGVALLMRVNGCSEVDLVDRYVSHRDEAQQKKIYEELARRHPLADFRRGEDWSERSWSGIEWRFGPAETFFERSSATGRPRYDFIVSRSVLEHTYDPLFALAGMARSLATAGRLIHKIDFRDHGMFTPAHHELKFLEVPARMYRRMTKNSGRPNRVLIHEYRSALTRLVAEGTLTSFRLLVTRLAGVGEIDPHRELEQIDPETRRRSMEFVDGHRNEFARVFRHVSAEDLAVTGVFLVAER